MIQPTTVSRGPARHVEPYRPVLRWDIESGLLIVRAPIGGRHCARHGGRPRSDARLLLGPARSGGPANGAHLVMPTAGVRGVSRRADPAHRRVRLPAIRGGRCCAQKAIRNADELRRSPPQAASPDEAVPDEAVRCRAYFLAAARQAEAPGQQTTCADFGRVSGAARRSWTRTEPSRLLYRPTFARPCGMHCGRRPCSTCGSSPMAFSAQTRRGRPEPARIAKCVGGPSSLSSLTSGGCRQLAVQRSQQPARRLQRRLGRTCVRRAPPLRSLRGGGGRAPGPVPRRLGVAGVA